MMFGLPNPYVLLGGAALAVGAWFAWEWQGSSHYAAGEAKVMAAWQESDRVAVAAGNEVSALLKRANAANTGVLNDKLTRLEQKAAARAVGLADALRTADELRNDLERRAAAPPNSDPAGASCRGYETKLQRCEGLLAGSLALAQEARGLVDHAEGLLERSEAALESLQRWAVIVQSANEAP